MSTATTPATRVVSIPLISVSFYTSFTRVRNTGTSGTPNASSILGVNSISVSFVRVHQNGNAHNVGASYATSGVRLYK